jgi:hypothetical protein
MPFAATIRPRSIGTRSSFAPESIEAIHRRRRNIKEKERRRLIRQCGGKFAMQIAVDFNHGHQHREPKAERQHHARRQCTGAMHIGHREPQHSRFLPRRMSRNPHDERRGQPQQQEHCCGGGEEERRDAAIVGGEDGERRKHCNDQSATGDVACPRPRSLAGDLIAEQH